MIAVGSRVRFNAGTPTDHMTFREGTGVVVEAVSEESVARTADWWVRPDGHTFLWPVLASEITALEEQTP